jgi:hypothetical protein
MLYVRCSTGSSASASALVRTHQCLTVSSASKRTLQKHGTHIIQGMTHTKGDTCSRLISTEIMSLLIAGFHHDESLAASVRVTVLSVHVGSYSSLCIRVECKRNTHISYSSEANIVRNCVSIPPQNFMLKCLNLYVPPPQWLDSPLGA